MQLYLTGTGERIEQGDVLVIEDGKISQVGQRPNSGMMR